ncbi:MAG: hypothetical protein WD971_04685, partial [Pirellulales bacterium]
RFGVDGASERELQFAAQRARVRTTIEVLAETRAADHKWCPPTRSVRQLKFGFPEAVSLAKPAKPTYEE